MDRHRILTAIGAFALIGLVGYVDSHVPKIVFSPLYLIPVFITSWFVSRPIGLCAAATSAAFGLVADLWSAQSPVGYAYANSVLRLALLTAAALTLGRLHEAISRERRVAEREREAAARLSEAASLRAELMRSVANDAREPLGEIYAKVVDLGFDMPPGASRAVLYEIATASSRLTELVDTLLLDAPELIITPPAGRASSLG